MKKINKKEDIPFDKSVSDFFRD